MWICLFGLIIPVLSVRGEVAVESDSMSCRIWFEITHAQRCRVSVTIFDLSGAKVRTYLDKPLGKGVYNFYWDKLDDSGAFVPEGNYRAVIDDCGRQTYENLTIRYLDGERELRIIPLPLAVGSAFQFIVLADSVRVDGEIINYADSVVDRPLLNACLNQGVHQFRWQPQTSQEAGKYTFRVTVGSFIHYYPFRFVQ